MSLLDITKLPTAENSAIHLHSGDNVAIARVPVSQGMMLRVAGREVRTRAAIPAGHKIALRPIAQGEAVMRYGQIIGRASKPIEPGDHVHTHNVAFEELALTYEFPEHEVPLPAAPDDVPTFLGFARDDGRAGEHRRRAPGGAHRGKLQGRRDAA